MGKILDKINNTNDLKNLSYKEKEKLAHELRELTIETVSKTGGHLASNLGVVELTIALHSVYNTPIDKIVWDVGHQTYIHKILTGRKNKIKTIRQINGLSGFPKRSESKYDCFDTGHSSTSISAALGMAKARDLKNEDNKVVAIIGDGALTGGLALEALNNAGSSKTNITVILNDNEMSISKNVGGISSFLSKLRTKKLYMSSNNFIKKALLKVPIIGEKVVQLARKVKHSVKQLVITNMFFEDIGFTYLGPVDGHNIEKIENLLKLSQKKQGPVLVHVITKKGKGYKPAEENPDKFHGVSPFYVSTGETKAKKAPDYSKAFGNLLIKIAERDKRIVAITAAMKTGTGLIEFANKFPDRFFDVGIAEQHALCYAAGLSANGIKPIVTLYSSFYQRGYDQVIHDICMQNLNVVMCIDRAGVVGNDGETHQGIYDISFLSVVPNLIIMAPKDFHELDQMLNFAVNINKPVAIRYPRGGEGNWKFNMHRFVKLGKAEILKFGTDVTIVAIGKMVERAIKVSNLLAKDGINVEVINARFIKPFDEYTIKKSIEKTKNVVTIEDNVITNGLGSCVEKLIIKNKLNNINIIEFAYPDKFVEHGTVSEIEKKYGMDEKTIEKKIRELISSNSVNKNVQRFL